MNVKLILALTLVLSASAHADDDGNPKSTDLGGIVKIRTYDYGYIAIIHEENSKPTGTRTNPSSCQYSDYYVFDTSINESQLDRLFSQVMAAQVSQRNIRLWISDAVCEGTGTSGRPVIYMVES